ncbi:S8 family serine peptidase [Bacillus sp. ISL-46]|uniref:S8 family serine peptidase n=1 Tax=Bacillus sp. ISL-46 TaxID=2819129 RepID=UPI001BE89446|nr:S8 family serine peptidase [Bacillus sp. ISL-46]MBT2724295.1 S8 family serine peptidase [Bacillus sp. ISL-46]
MKKKNIKNFFNILLILCLLLPQMQTVVLASNNENMKEENESHISLSQYNDLEKKSDKNGSVRVIVELDESFTPEGKISKNKIDIQKKKIKVAQEDVIANLHKKGQKNAKNITSFKTIPFMALEVDSEGLKALSESEKVKNIIEDIKISKSIIEENEEVDVIQPQLNVTNNLMDTEKAWTAGYTGQGKTVAILDTGVDKYHPFLRNKVVSEACFSSTGHCSGNARELTGPDSAVDTEGHGTHVAGIATGNGTQFSGVAKNANIIAIKVLADDGSGSFSDLLNGVERVYLLRNQYAISAVNLSLGGGRFYSSCDSTYSSLKSMVDNLKSVGIATIAASGNEYYKNSISAPACISSVISVGATNNSDAVASFSNSSAYLDVLAPGNPVYSSIPGGGYASYSGTSMATPQVVGGFTLVKQKYPSATVDQIVSYIRQNGVNIRDTANNIITPRLDFSWMETSLPALSQVQKPTWNGDVIQWVGVTNASQYEVKLYRGTTLVTTERVASSVRQFNFASQMTTPGVYKGTVQAIGNHTSYNDGAISILSDGNSKGVVYFEDFERNNGNFTAAGNNSTWQWGTPTSGPNSAYSGTNVWATSLSGNYNNYENSYIVSPNINLSNLGSPITLSWMQYAVTEAGYDYLNVEITNDGGQTWDSVYRNSGTINPSWGKHEVTIDTSYAVPDFKVRFRMVTDGSSTSSGIYIDDVMVTGSRLLPSLTQVQKPTWNGDVIQWVGVTNASQYEVKLYRGTTLVSTHRVASSDRQFNFASLMTSPGGYTATVQAIGDPTNYRDGLISIPSNENRKTYALNQVQKPTWNGDAIQWVGVTNANQYEVKLYRGTTLVNTQRVEDSVRQYNFASAMTSSGVYTVTVQAIGDHTNYGDGQTSLPSDGVRKEILYFEDFESNNGNFTVDGSYSTWQWGAPTSGPNSAFSGTNVWATNLSGNYHDNENSYIVSPNLDLSNVGSPITLSWMQYAVTENGFDYLNVEISKDSGQTWDSIYRNTGTINQNWGSHEVTIDNSYAVPDFKVRFRLATDSSVTTAGVYIDDVKMTGSRLAPTLDQVQKPTWNGDVINWNGIANANQYDIKLYRGTTLINTQRLEASVREYNYAALMTTPGEYTATVQAIGDQTNYRDGLISSPSDVNRKTIALDQVQQPIWNNDVIQWNGIANAYQYEVKLYRGTTLINTERVGAYVQQVDYAALMTTPGGYSVTVQAIGDQTNYRDGLISHPSNVNSKFMTLDQVQKPTWNGDVIQWSGVANANQYEIKLYRGTTLINIQRVAASVQQYNYDALMTIPSDYTVTVQAIGDDSNYLDGPISSPSDVNRKIMTLAQVQKPTWNGDVIQWYGVSNAYQYEVKLYRGTTLIKTQRVSASVRQVNYAALMSISGSYKVTVQAIGDNRSYRNGPVSVSSNLKITLNQVQKPTWKTDVIQWVGVAHTYQYEVKLYRGTTLIKTLRVGASVRQVNYAGLMNRPGSYTVSVRAIGDNRSSRNGSVSARSNQKITLNQVQKPTWSSNTIKWNGVSKAAQYEVKLYRGSTLVNTKRVAANVRQINYATQMKKSGKYTVTVQAIGDNKSYRNGPISARSNQKSK